MTGRGLSDGDDLDDLIAEFSAQHPWTWRRQRIKSWVAVFVGKRLPFLCRHNGTTGPAGAGYGWCLYCGRKVEYDDD